MHRFPLFRLNFSNKTSYLLGTNHWCPLIKLSPIHDFILNKKKLIVESKPHDYINLSPINYSDAIQNFRKINNYPFKIQDNHMRKFYEINIVKNISSYNFNKILDEMCNKQFYPRIIRTDLNSKFISELLVIMFYLNGVDHQLISYYTNKKQKVYSLDLDDDEIKKYKKLAYENMCKHIRLLLYPGILLKNKISFEYYWQHILKNIIQGYLDKDYFELILDYKGNHDDNIIIGKRNNIWIPKIIQYHKTLDDPIFVVGYGHLFGEYDLFKKLKNKEKDLKVQIYDLKYKVFYDYKNNF